MKFRKVLKYLLFPALMVGLGFLYSFSSTRNLQIKIAEPIVEFEEGDNNFLTYSMVNKLSKHPDGENATIFLTIDGRLKTIIKQRIPVARIVLKSGSYYIDKQGVKVPLSNNYSARVMLISGVENVEAVNEILPLISLILGDEFLHKEIVGIEKSDVHEYKFSVRSGDYKINFGKLSEMETKFKKLKAFYSKTFKDKTIKNYNLINLKYHNQVVCIK
jgi:cell division protein FtsQ